MKKLPKNTQINECIFMSYLSPLSGVYLYIYNILILNYASRSVEIQNEE